MLYTEKKVNIKNIKQGMVLSRDVLSKIGVTLMTKNSVIKHENLEKLYDYDIDSVYIVDVNMDAVTQFENHSLNKDDFHFINIEQSPTFKNFAIEHEIKTESLRRNFNKINNGEQIDTHSLYQLVQDVLDTLDAQGDIFLYLNHLESADDATCSHCLNVAMLCTIFGGWLKLEPDELKNVTSAGVLHDIGMLKIDRRITNKTNAASDAEIEILKSHTSKGYEMIRHLDINEDVKSAVLLHHEKVDGTGYPKGIRGAQIPDYAKIVCITDTYEEMTSKQAGHDSLCPFDVIRVFSQDWNGLLDIRFQLIFLEHIAYNYLGYHVELTNNDIAKIIFINKTNYADPIVRTTYNEYINLSKTGDLKIKRLL